MENNTLILQTIYLMNYKDNKLLSHQTPASGKIYHTTSKTNWIRLKSTRRFLKRYKEEIENYVKSTKDDIYTIFKLIKGF